MTTAKKRISLLFAAVFLCTCISFIIAPREVEAAANFVPRDTNDKAPETNNPYYTTCNPYYPTYGMPNCTCYAWGRAYEITGKKPTIPTIGNAEDWFERKNIDGYERGQIPKLGAIVCWNYAGGGHVAVVEKIEGNTITLSESAWPSNNSPQGRYFYTQTTDNVPGLYKNWQGYIYILNEPFEIQNGVLTKFNPDVYGSNDVVIPDGVTSIGNRAFYECENLKTVKIPESVKSIGNYAFDGCENLKTVEISNGVTSIGNYAFWGCHNLTSITIPGSVQNIGDDVFSWCNNLKHINISNGVKSIGDSTFWGCTALESILIPNSVTSIGWGHLTNARA